MKKRILMLAAVFALAAGMLGGCGNNSQSASGSVNESISDVSAQSEADTDNQEADAKDGQDTSEAAAEPVVLEDGNLIPTAACSMPTRHTTAAVL